MVGNVRSMLISKANAMKVLAEAPMSLDDQAEFIKNISDLLGLGLNIVKRSFKLNDDQLMSLLTLAVVRIIEIVDDDG